MKSPIFFLVGSLVVFILKEQLCKRNLDHGDSIVFYERKCQINFPLGISEFLAFKNYSIINQ